MLRHHDQRCLDRFPFVSLLENRWEIQNVDGAALFYVSAGMAIQKQHRFRKYG